MKGILLAGGKGSRLHPLTKCFSKHLLPVYDKPMIYYPLSCLMLAGIREILLISTPTDLPLYQKLLQDGAELGISICYAEQQEPNGIGEAFLIAEKFIDRKPVALILGDNLFYGEGLPKLLRNSSELTLGAQIFGYAVADPSQYGVVQLDHTQKPIAIIEKPKQLISKWAVPGFYFYDEQVVDIARTLKPSARGELEITDINQQYLKQGQLTCVLLGRGMTWLDTGLHHQLLESSNFVQVIETRQGLKIACLEEIAYRMGFINAEQLEQLANKMVHNEYGQYLLQLLEREVA